MFVHGGGWHGGDPYVHIRHAHGLAARGYVAAVISYRLGAEAGWPASLEDVQAAVRWVRDNAAAIGADPDRIAVAGGSAGGHLAAMMALDPDTVVKAAVLWYPATELTGFIEQDDLREMVESYFGDQLVEASPVNRVHPGARPMLSMTGDLDPLTTVEMVRRFHETLDEAGAPNRLVVFEGRSHAFDLYPQDWQASFDLMAAFLDEVL